MVKKRKERKVRSWMWISAMAVISAIVSLVLISSPNLKSSLSLDNSTPIKSVQFYPPVLRSLIVNPESKTNYFDFVLDIGNEELDLDGDSFKPEAKKLINYFFLGLTLPSEDLWVNLNPVQADKVVSPRLTSTDIGKVLLEVDLTLKKDAARLTDPRTPLGKEYWTKLRQKLAENGIHSLAILPLSRLWIVPKDATMEEEGPNKVNIISAKLKVCLESEYLNKQNSGIVLISSQDPQEKLLHDCAISVMKEVILPRIEHDVNYSKRYAPVRQVYYSLLLAEYFKQKYQGKEGLYNSYFNTGYLNGLESEKSWSKDKFFQAYVESYKNGEYSFNQEEYDSFQLATVNRHYFYGGGDFASLPNGFQNRIPIEEGPGEDNVLMAHLSMVDPSNGQMALKVTTAPANPVEVEEIRVEETAKASSAIARSPLIKESKFITLAQLGDFAGVLRNQHGLEANIVQVGRIHGSLPVGDFFKGEQVIFAVDTSIAAALGSRFFAAGGSQVSPVADANAVTLAEDNIRAYVRANPNVAIVIIGTEGKRDRSRYLEAASIYFHAYDNQLKVFQDENEVVQLAEFEQELALLEAQGVRLRFLVGDFLEVTKGLVHKDALTKPTNSWAMVNILDERNPLILDTAGIVGISFHAPTDAGVEPFDLPSVALPKIAKANGINPNNKKEFADFMNSTEIVVLGPREEEEKKEYEAETKKHRHQEIIDDALALKKKYSDLKVALPGDGDMKPRVFAILGIPLDGYKMVTFGRSGPNEAKASLSVAEVAEGGQFVWTYVSKKSTNDDVSIKKAYQYKPEEIEAFAKLGIPKEQYTRTMSGGIKGKGIFVTTAVTGASEDIFGKSVADLFGRVEIARGKAKEGVMTTNTFVVTRDGSAFVVQTQFFTPNFIETRNSIQTVSKEARAYLAKASSSVTAPHQAIVNLIEARDIRYMAAVNSKDTAKLVSRPEAGKFTPGHDAFQELRKNKQSAIAVNVVSYSQIEGHIKAAMKQNAILILEVARSQLGYALNETKVMEYVSATIERITKETDQPIPPIVVHGDHIQYTEASFKQKAILKAEYEKVNGKGSFKEGLDVSQIDRSILETVQAVLKENAAQERQKVAEINERLIKAGFTSIAIDASTIYDEVAGDLVLGYYLTQGTSAEQLVAKLEKEFALPLEWGTELLKLDPATAEGKEKFEAIEAELEGNMRDRGKPEAEIKAIVKELEVAFGVLVKQAIENNLNPQEVIKAYDKVMEEVAKASVVGDINSTILGTLSENQKLLLIPTSNAEETAYQVKNIQELVKEHRPGLVGHFGIEVEVGHVDRKHPNPKRQGKMEAKMTHPLAVRVMGEYLTIEDVSFDLIATNNGSGHGTDFDKQTLTPVSQVGKISPFLSRELQKETSEFDAALAQHGTSGSDDAELAVLSNLGEVKFNVATNYQQITMNVLSLLDNGLTGEALLEEVESDKDALMGGLHEDVRKKMLEFGKEIESDPAIAEVKEDDTLFVQFLKLTYGWGLGKKKLQVGSTDKDIATIMAKESKRVFGKMDNALVKLAEASSQASSAIALNRAIYTKRTPIIGGNWKMALGTKEEARELLLQMSATRIEEGKYVEIFVAPSYAHLQIVSEALRELEESGSIPEGLIKLGAQNMYAEEEGAFTGGISARQLKNLGVSYVILGHSELRRNPKQELTGESNANVNRKLKTALQHGLIPVVCVGESLAERESGRTVELVDEMTRESLDGISAEDDAFKVVIAYEPVWAIGTGKSATPQQADETHQVVRSTLFDMFGEEAASKMRIQYGGSVTDEKIAGLIAMPNIDGALVGGASLKPRDFAGIARGAAQASRARESSSPFQTQPAIPSQARNVGGVDLTRLKFKVIFFEE